MDYEHCTDAPRPDGQFSKPQQKFLVSLFATISIVVGKVNFKNLSRYSELLEKTYRRQFSKAFEFVELNRRVIEQAMPAAARNVVAMDCSFTPKSGKKTYGKDYFYNGTAGRTEAGLEISVIAVINLDSNEGYTLSLKQPPANESSSKAASTTVESANTASKKRKSSKKSPCKRGKNKETQSTKTPVEPTRIDLYLKQLKVAQPYLPTEVDYLVADGYYAKEKFVSGVVGLKLHLIGKLRIDANMRYLYTGEQKPRGRQRKYGDKVHLSNLTHFTQVKELQPGIKLYTAVVWHVSLKRLIRLAYLHDERNPKKLGKLCCFPLIPHLMLTTSTASTKPGSKLNFSSEMPSSLQV